MDHAEGNLPSTDPGMEGNVTLRDPTPEEVIVSLRAEVQGLRVTLGRKDENLTTLREANTRLQSWIDELGQAIRAKAIEHEWCSEYDTFAEEWDLPKRWLNFGVTMTVTVTASDEESALEMVRDAVSLSSYTEGVTDGPEFEASEE